MMRNSISNITILAIDNNFKKDIAKELSSALDMFYVDVDDFIKYDITDISKVISTAGVDYYNKLEHGTLKRLFSYENSILTLNLETLNKNNNKQIVKDNSLTIFVEVDFKTYKSFIKEDNLELLNLTVFNERNKLLEDFAEIIIKINKKSQKNVINIIIGELKKYYNIGEL